MPRLLKLFDRAGLRTTWFIPGHTAESFPEQTQQVAEAGHEIGLHGYSHENPLSMSPEQERAVLERSIEVLERFSGRRPVGYVAPWWEFSRITNELLLEYGIKYDNSLMHTDHLPYYVRVGDGWTPIDYARPADTWMKPFTRGHETALIEIPGSWYLDDLPPMMFVKKSPEQPRVRQPARSRGALARPVRLPPSRGGVRGLPDHDPPRRERPPTGAADAGAVDRAPERARRRPLGDVRGDGGRLREALEPRSRGGRRAPPSPSPRDDLSRP